MSGCYFKKADLISCKSVEEFLEKHGEKIDFKTFCENANEIYSSHKYPVITFQVPNETVGAVLYNKSELARYIKDRGIPPVLYIVPYRVLIPINGVSRFL